MQSRRRFISQGLLSAGAMPAEAFSPQRLTILHTNDTHSRLDPFPMDGGRNQGMGGVAARAELIRQIRLESPQVLLLDAGDIFQGTPYFNLYKGEPEIRAMTEMQYDACTIGNHDFDAGMENLATQLERHARFPMLVCNYDFSGTPMEHRTKPYEIFRKGKLKIGVLGVGIELRGLVPDNLYGATKYLDPVQQTNTIAATLREQGCDLVICLSHLGYQYTSGGKVSDEVLARESYDIDVIIGGHTHSFLEQPVVFPNRNGSDVIVNQVGFAGLQLGRMDFEFSKFSGKKISKSQSISVSRKTGG